MAEHNDDPSTYPRLGQFLHRLATPDGAKKLIWTLIAACLLFGLLDLTYEKHGYMDMERYFGFYAAFGFVAFAFVIFAAKALRRLVKKPEDFYAPFVIDTEDYPEDGLDKADHDA